MTLIYDFTLTLADIGKPYQVTAPDQSVVATGTVAAKVVSLALAEGTYAMRGTPGFPPGLTGTSVLGVPASIAAGGGVGASETAYFVATADTSADTAGGDATAVVWVADDRHGALPSWASVDGDGNVALGDDAGTCAYNFRGRYNFDFSGTTPQESSGDLGNGIGVRVDGANASVRHGTQPGDGEDIQVGPVDKSKGLIDTSLSAEGFPSADDVTDGIATIEAALTITRLAQAPVLPA